MSRLRTESNSGHNAKEPVADHCTVKEPDTLLPFADALIVTTVAEDTVLVCIVQFAELDPAETMMLPGMLANTEAPAVMLSETATFVCAGVSRFTVPVTGFPPVTVLALKFIETS